MQRAYRHFIVAAALLGARTASAQAPDPAAAQALFDDAKQLMAKGRFVEACPKFQASLRLDPKPGAAINLADCYERNGQTASAWVRYREAASLAQRAGQAEREQYATDHAAALEPKLSRLTIVAPSAPAGFALLRDGAPVDAAVLGTAVPVDPDTYLLEARAPGKKPWSRRVEVGGNGARVRVEVPALEDASAAPSGGEEHAATGAREGGLGTQRAVGIVLGVAGLAGLGVGSAFGVVAANNWSKWKETKNVHCGGTTQCDEAGFTLARDAKNAATVSTALFVAGGVLLAVGVVVFATAPKRKATPSASLWIGPNVKLGGAGFSAQGVF